VLLFSLTYIDEKNDDSLRSPKRKRGKAWICFSVGNEKKKEERLDMRQGG